MRVATVLGREREETKQRAGIRAGPFCVSLRAVVPRARRRQRQRVGRSEGVPLLRARPSRGGGGRRHAPAARRPRYRWHRCGGIRCTETIQGAGAGAEHGVARVPQARRRRALEAGQRRARAAPAGRAAHPTDEGSPGDEATPGGGGANRQAGWNHLRRGHVYKGRMHVCSPAAVGAAPEAC